MSNHISKYLLHWNILKMAEEFIIKQEKYFSWENVQKNWTSILIQVHRYSNQILKTYFKRSQEIREVAEAPFPQPSDQIVEITMAWLLLNFSVGSAYFPQDLPSISEECVCRYVWIWLLWWAASWLNKWMVWWGMVGSLAFFLPLLLFNLISELKIVLCQTDVNQLIQSLDEWKSRWGGLGQLSERCSFVFKVWSFALSVITQMEVGGQGNCGIKLHLWHHTVWCLCLQSHTWK